MYDTILLDLDHTLFDTDQSEVAAFTAMLESFGVRSDDQLLAEYRVINRGLWERVEQGELTPDFVRVARFSEFAALQGMDVGPHAMAERFGEGLKQHGSLYPGARDVLDRLSGGISLGLVTNGLSDIQRARIERLGLEPYFQAIVISSEVDVAKPHPRIFSIALELLGNPSPNSVLMVGDSLSSDMAGAAAFGIDGCWYNPSRTPHPGEPAVAREIAALGELIPLVER